MRRSRRTGCRAASCLKYAGDIIWGAFFVPDFDQRTHDGSHHPVEKPIGGNCYAEVMRSILVYDVKSGNGADAVLGV